MLFYGPLPGFMSENKALNQYQLRGSGGGPNFLWRIHSQYQAKGDEVH
jgi:hypothetical protein